MSTRSVIWLAIFVFALSLGAITPEGTQHHEATLVRDDIGHALTCWTITGEDIFCQETT